VFSVKEKSKFPKKKKRGAERKTPYFEVRGGAVELAIFQRGRGKFYLAMKKERNKQILLPL